jgi:hypothetical protein
MTTLETPWAHVDLSLFRGDPFEEVVTVHDKAGPVSWSGSYTAQVRAQEDEDSELLATLGVTANVVGNDTLFTITLSEAESALILPNSYWWSARHSSGVTRLHGQFIVKPTITP